MAHASVEDLTAYTALLRQLREIKGLTEKRPGIYYYKATAFLHFHNTDGAEPTIDADMKKVPGSGFDRFEVSTPEQQRKLVDEAKKRVKKLQDDD
jgi:hypothetical protein